MAESKSSLRKPPRVGRGRCEAAEPVSHRLKERAEELLGREFGFIDSAEFDGPDADAAILAEPAGPEPTGAVKRPQGLPAYLAGLYEVPLLTAEQEVVLFRKMNYLKFKANRLRSRLDPGRPDEALMDEFERLLFEEKAVRNRIARSNLRLVVSIARKFAEGGNGFDEYVSDGNVALLHAIAKFDYGRGYRFSTYATHAIRRALLRQIRNKQRRKNRLLLGASQLIDEAEGRPELRPGQEAQYRHFEGLIERMSDRLDDREQAILAARFGLGGAAKGLTLQRVAKKLGICKERVRQLQNRAIEKLRRMAREMNVEVATEAG